MTQTSVAKAESRTDVHFWSRIVEQRREARVDFRTTGFAFPLKPEGLAPLAAPVRIWTVDVSTTGALVRCYEKIESQRVLVELVMPQMAGAFIEGTIARSSEETARYLNGKERRSFLYGIQFTRLIKKDSVPQDFLEHGKSFKSVDELSQLSADQEQLPSSVDASKSNVRQSLVPLLAAIAMIVVNLALWFAF